MTALYLGYLVILTTGFALSLGKGRQFVELRTLATWTFFVLFSLAIGLRNVDAGIDTQSVYRPVYENIFRLSDVLTRPTFVASYDSQLFWAFFGISSLLGLSLSAYYVVHCLMLFSLLYFISKKSRIDSMALTSTYCCTLLFLMSSANTLRQGIAVLLFLLLCSLAFNRSWRASAFCFVALVFVHGSGILVAPLAVLPLLARRRSANFGRLQPFIVYAAVAAVLLILSLSNIANLFSSVFEEKAMFYIEAENSFSSRTPFERPWVMGSIFMALGLFAHVWLSRRRSKNTSTDFLRSHYFFEIYILAVATWIAVSGIPGVFERFGDYVAGLQIFIFAAIAGGMTKKMVVYRFLGMLACGILAYSNYMSESVGIFFE